MANSRIIKHKRSSVPGRVPDSANISVGEIAINLNDRLIYSKRDDGNVVIVGYGTLENYTGNIAPSQHSVFSIGNTTHRFKDLYLSGNTLYLGDSQIKFEEGKFKFQNSDGTPANTQIYTGNLIESAENLFFTNARAYANTLSAIKTGNGIVYDSATGNITLSATGVTASTYGGGAQIPVITIDTHGRITSAANVSVGGITSFTSNGNTFAIATSDGNTYYANIQPNSIRLADDTTGEYVANLTAGTGVTITGAGGETSNPTINIGQAVETTSDVTFANVTVTGTLFSNDITSSNVTVYGDTTITGNLVVQGTTVTLETESVVVEDKNLLLANGSPNAAAADGAGITIDGAGANLIYLNASDSWNFNKDLNVTGDLNISIDANIAGNLIFNVVDVGEY